MKTLLVFFMLLTYISCGYYIYHFVGFGQKVPNDPQYVRIKPDDQPYLGIEEQSQLGCEHLTQQLNDIIEDMRNQNQRDLSQIKFSFIGHSQGGLVARHVFMTCEPVRNYVKRIITLGTPNLGIDQITIGYSNQYAEEDEQDPTQTTISASQNQAKLAQNNLSLSERFGKTLLNTVANTWVSATYQQNQCPKVYKHSLGAESPLIAFLNLENLYEIDKTTQKSLQEVYQEMYKNLELFLTVSFTKENMVSIIESPSFGTKIYEKGKKTEAQVQQAKQKYQTVITKRFQELLNECQQECQDESDELKNKCEQECNAKCTQRLNFLQKKLDNFYLNDELYVERFNAYKMKDKYYSMIFGYVDHDDTIEKNSEIWKQHKQQYIQDNVNIPLADTLEEMYNQGNFIQCAVTGFHLQFPSDYFIASEQPENFEILDYQDFIMQLAYFDIGSLNFNFLMNKFNCHKGANIII